MSWYGASNIQTILAQSTPFGLNVRKPGLKLLLGDLPDKVPELATLASPVAHVGAGYPPALLLHGKVFNSGEPAERVVTFLRRTIGR